MSGLPIMVGTQGRSMDTAPKDGRPIRVLVQKNKSWPGIWCECRWNSELETWSCDRYHHDPRDAIGWLP